MTMENNDILRNEFNQNLKVTIAKHIDKLEKNNNGIQGMNYYYEVFKELYGKRIKELRYQKEIGKKIIGVFCNFIPEELILACDGIPIRLCTGFQETIIQAEEILPRNFCPLIKSSLGTFMSESAIFDILDLVIVPTTCDGKKKLAEIFADHIHTWILEVPHTIDTPQARQHWLTEIRLLKKKLEIFTKNRIKIKNLKAAIELMNRKRSAARRLYELRKRNPPSIWGRDALLVTNLSLYDDIKRWTEQTEVLCDEIEHNKSINANMFPRLMITGSPVVFPTWKIPMIIEESGGVIVIDDICTGSKELWEPVETVNWSLNSMLVGLADKYLMNTCACFTPNVVRQEIIIKFIKEYEVDGVIYHTLQACHIYGMEQNRIIKALERIKIPVLSIETDYSQEDIEQIRTRIEAFLEMISQRRHTTKINLSTNLKSLSKPKLPTSLPVSTTIEKPVLSNMSSVQIKNTSQNK